MSIEVMLEVSFGVGGFLVFAHSEQKCQLKVLRRHRKDAEHQAGLIDICHWACLFEVHQM